MNSNVGHRWHSLLYFIAVGFGSGLIRFAPGTFGTLAAIPFYLLLRNCSEWLYLVIVTVSFLVGIWICQVAEDDMGVPDHPSIVWDEVVGYWITMFAAPSGWQWIVIGFILFRLFDIVKPWPIRSLERSVKGGLGVMLDDVVAGIFAWVILQGFSLFR